MFPTLWLILIMVKQISCEYAGESFPTKYLYPDGYNVTSTDLEHYVSKIFHPLAYFNEAPNKTDVSGALCAFYTKSLLKRTIKDYGSKMTKNQEDSLKNLIQMSENIVSHYTYKNARYGWDDMEFRVSKLFLSDESQVHYIKDFNKNKLRRWIVTKDNNMNKHLEAMDKATLPKEMYGILTDRNPGDTYYIGMYESDTCVSQIAYNGEPIDTSQLRKCKPNKFCEEQLYSNPSIGYYLSHRFVNMYLRFSKGCYIRSELEDIEMMDRLCGNMYREAVYLARRGYFARDVFLEMVALCSMLGYEEFHRKNWFYKTSSWINEHGCVVEDRNFVKNRTKLVKTISDVRKRAMYRKYYCKQLMSECDEHPTALFMIVMAHAIRHAARFMSVKIRLFY